MRRYSAVSLSLKYLLRATEQNTQREAIRQEMRSVSSWSWLAEHLVSIGVSIQTLPGTQENEDLAVRCRKRPMHLK